MKPLCIDLFCGLGGWTDGFLAEGYSVTGFDIERHHYGDQKYPGQLVLQDVLTIHGSQFKDAAVIVASPPCQNYSYLAMPWSRSTNPNNSKAAKALRAKWECEGPDNRLFDACFRIQREAIEATSCNYCCDAAGRPVRDCPICRNTHKRFIPLVVENVRGAQPWVGRSAWNYGSFHLWGNVPALMPFAFKVPPKRAMDDLKYGQRKLLHQHLPVGNGPLGRNDGTEGQKVPAYSDPRRNGGKGVHLTSPHENHDGMKIGGDWFSDPKSTCRKHGSRPKARKAASAQIAKIPLPLSQHIARVYYPRTKEAVA